MEFKSVCDCLNFIDSTILCGIEKLVGIGNLKDMRNSILEKYNDKYMEGMVSMSAIISQINLIIGNFYLDKDSDIKKHYCTLRKRILVWLQESNLKPEFDNDE